MSCSVQRQSDATLLFLGRVAPDCAIAVARRLGAGGRVRYAATKGNASLFGRALAELRPSDLEKVRTALRVLVTDETASAEMLLQPTGSNVGQQDSRLVITIKLIPYQTTWGNVGV